MAQIFRPNANQVARLSLVLGLLGAAGALALLYFLDRSPYHTKQGIHVAQEVPFSHDHHTAGLGIDCRYCHTTVETSAFAGVPPTATCMNCHKQIWANADMLEPVRQSWGRAQPLRWNRVNDLPDFVYFNHSIHIRQGIGCGSCHGRVDNMPLMRQQHSLQMGWCLDCHQNPERYVRPRDQVFNMDWQPGNAGTTQAVLGPRLVAEYHINPSVSCSTCHR